jgi:hypothetical protein
MGDVVDVLEARERLHEDQSSMAMGHRLCMQIYVERQRQQNYAEFCAAVVDQLRGTSAIGSRIRRGKRDRIAHCSGLTGRGVRGQQPPVGPARLRLTAPGMAASRSGAAMHVAIGRLAAGPDVSDDPTRKHVPPFFAWTVMGE